MNDLISHKSASGPVECLGLTFPSDNARREHFRIVLAEKLKDAAFRAQEGFPVGTDEAILGLSDPPYYTACPNPWLQDFVSAYGTAYSKESTYRRDPFTADVSEGKNDPIYNAHGYHTKVPHKAIMRYVLHYTEPNDLILDAFCGTGMTGVAAQLCGDRLTVQSLGYVVDPDGTIRQSSNDVGKSEWLPFSKIGARRAVLNDLSPAATFIAHNYNAPRDSLNFEVTTRDALQELQSRFGWMFQTLHNASDNHIKDAISLIHSEPDPKLS